tara:strand:+ start:1788 stop:2141 length:354 start_codon:yes stop_codon:yes gene_type:complete
MAAKWTINQCDDYKQKDGHSKVIFNLHWSCSDDREYPNPEGGDPLVAHGSVYGTCAVSTDDIQDFTPYDEVTEAMALSWLFSVMTVEQKAGCEASVEKQIADKIDPPTESGLPWASE